MNTIASIDTTTIELFLENVVRAFPNLVTLNDLKETGNDDAFIFIWKEHLVKGQLPTPMEIKKHFYGMHWHI